MELAIFLGRAAEKARPEGKEEDSVACRYDRSRGSGFDGRADSKRARTSLRGSLAALPHQSLLLPRNVSRGSRAVLADGFPCAAQSAQSSFAVRGRRFGHFGWEGDRGGSRGSCFAGADSGNDSRRLRPQYETRWTLGFPRVHPISSIFPLRLQREVLAGDQSARAEPFADHRRLNPQIPVGPSARPGRRPAASRRPPSPARRWRGRRALRPRCCRRSSSPRARRPTSKPRTPASCPRSRR